MQNTNAVFTPTITETYLLPLTKVNQFLGGKKLLNTQRLIKMHTEQMWKTFQTGNTVPSLLLLSAHPPHN